jgi:hypothetical protein
LERVEVLSKMARGMRIAAVRCHCGVNELIRGSISDTGGIGDL